MSYVAKPTDVSTLREALEKLTPEDREKYNRDLVLFGNAVMKHLDDGRVVYVSADEFYAKLNDKPLTD